jgi:hypothetical protein
VAWLVNLRSVKLSLSRLIKTMDAFEKARLINFVLDAQHRVVGLFLTAFGPFVKKYLCIVIEGDAMTICDSIEGSPTRCLASTALYRHKTVVAILRSVESAIISLLCRTTDEHIRRFALRHLATPTSISWSDDSMALCSSWLRLATLNVDPIVPNLALLGERSVTSNSEQSEHMVAMRDSASPIRIALPRMICDAVAYLNDASFVWLCSSINLISSPGPARTQGLAWVVSASTTGLDSPIPMVQWQAARSGLMTCQDYDSRAPDSRAVQHVLEACGAVIPGAESCSALNSREIKSALLFDRTAVPLHIAQGALGRSSHVGLFIEGRAADWMSRGGWLEETHVFDERISATLEGTNLSCMGRGAPPEGSVELRRRDILAEAQARASYSSQLQQAVDANLARNARMLLQLSTSHV